MSDVEKVRKHHYIRQIPIKLCRMSLVFDYFIFLFSKDYLSSCKRLSFTLRKIIYYNAKDSLLQKKCTLFAKKTSHNVRCLPNNSYLCSVNSHNYINRYGNNKEKRTREEVRAAFREYLKDKKKRMEEKQHELEEIHQMRMSGMTMEEIFA